MAKLSTAANSHFSFCYLPKQEPYVFNPRHINMIWVVMNAIFPNLAHFFKFPPVQHLYIQLILWFFCISLNVNTYQPLRQELVFLIPLFQQQQCKFQCWGAHCFVLSLATQIPGPLVITIPNTPCTGWITQLHHLKWWIAWEFDGQNVGKFCFSIFFQCVEYFTQMLFRLPVLTACRRI